MALTKVSGHVIDQPFDVGIITATNFRSGVATVGTMHVTGNLQVDGTTTTLDTIVTEVDRLEVGANNSTVGLAVTQSGSGDAAIFMGGNIGIATASPRQKLDVEGNINVVGIVTATTFVGNVTGNITGNITGGSTADFSIADKIVHTGDTNTAIRFPAVDTITAETGGTERVRITSDGLVGIGTDTPGSKLHVDSGTDAVISKFTSSNTSSASLEIDSLASNYTELKLKKNGTVYGNLQVAFNDVSLIQQQNANLRFYTNNTERIRILANGVTDFKDNSITNVGSIALDSIKGYADDNTNITFAGNDTITFKAGNTSPALTINTTQVKVEDDQKFVAGTGNDLQIYHDGSHSYINQSTAGNLYITHGSETMIGAFADGKVELRYDNSTKLETTATGAKVTGALEVTQEYPSIRPTLDLNFAATKTLDRRITFTRDSIGTFTGEDGLVKYASNNVPRFDHDPTTRESLGLLIEESRTNMVQYSSSGSGLNDAPYYGNWNAAPYTDNFAVAPDGTTTAWKMTPTTPSSSRQRTVSVTAGNTYTFSVWLKKDPSVSVSDGVWNYFKYLITWNTSPIGATTQQLVSGSTTSAELTTEWRRFSVSYTAPAGVTTMQFGLSNANSGSGDPGYSVFVWGAQLEEGSFATSYIPTSGSTVTRAADTAKITGTNFTDFYNKQESTIFFESSISKKLNSKYFTFQGAGLSTELIESAATSGPGANIFTYLNSSIQSNFSVTDPSAITLKYAAGVEKNNINIAVNGTLGTPDTSAVHPGALDQLIIGNYNSGSYHINSAIKRFSYYNKRLPDAQLQGLTQQ